MNRTAVKFKEEKKMSEFENMEAMELTVEQMNEIAGGAFKPLPPKTGFIVYQIVKGDTLNKIGRKFNCTAQQIKSWNPKIVDINKIYYGDYLYIKA